MSDVIIAIVPAPGHEGLVADGPLGERPALVYRCGCGRWGHSGCASLTWPRPRALVLHVPDGSRLGMVRAVESLDIEDFDWCWHADRRRPPQEGDPVGATLTGRGERIDVVVNPWPMKDRHTPAAYALVVAHLLHQRGKGSEVLVLPVPA